MRYRIGSPPEGTDLQAVAAKAKYVGSPDHKRQLSHAGPPKPRADASKCDPNVGSQRQLTEWLREAIERGTVSELWEGDFPRYAWHRVGDVCYAARLTNSVQGDYHGYPLEREEWPPGV